MLIQSCNARSLTPCQASRLACAERQRAAALQARAAADPASLPAERAADNEPLVRSMNKVMAGMHQYQFEVYRNPEVGAAAAGARQLRKAPRRPSFPLACLRQHR